MSKRPAFGRKSVMTRAAQPGETEIAAVAAAGAAFAPADEKYVFAGGIGEGGMGEVLLVEDKDLKRQVAMKLLRPELAETPAPQPRSTTRAGGGGSGGGDREAVYGRRRRRAPAPEEPRQLGAAPTPHLRGRPAPVSALQGTARSAQRAHRPQGR
jgi:hypothetical protein